MKTCSHGFLVDHPESGSAHSHGLLAGQLGASPFRNTRSLKDFSSQRKNVLQSMCTISSLKKTYDSSLGNPPTSIFLVATKVFGTNQAFTSNRTNPPKGRPIKRRPRSFSTLYNVHIHGTDREVRGTLMIAAVH